MRGLVINLASTLQTENPRGFSEVGENKQLLIAIVSGSFFKTNVLLCLVIRYYFFLQSFQFH
ncbi:hypothetical protein EI424_12530 [Tenacibaculum singaporense]|nr:hypothetical protein EI424_12530 [Tenacibaculum singaporense]